MTERTAGYQVSFYFDAEGAKALDKLVELWGVSRNQAARRAILFSERAYAEEEQAIAESKSFHRA